LRDRNSRDAVLERVQRIVSSRYAKRDGSAVTAFVDRDLIRDAESASSARRVGERFGQAIDREGDSLVANYGVHQLERWEEAGPRRFAVPAEALGGSERFAFIHVPVDGRQCRCWHGSAR
jgi:hypothetical protein